jgi:hypothetical protein
MYEKGGISAMLFDLFSVDCEAHNLREAPKTHGLFYQLQQNFSSFEKFWYEKLAANRQVGEPTSYGVNASETMTKKSKLYDEYVNYCKKINEKYILTAAVFGKHLAKCCKFGVKQMLDDDQKYSRFYVFPSKQDCKRQFSNQLGMNIDWDKSIEENDDSGIDEI